VEKAALLVLDTQVNMFDDEFCVHDPESILGRIENLISSARDSNAPVIFVRNNGVEGDPDEPGTAGWEIHPRIFPDNDDLLIDKSSPDAFEGTSLSDHLRELGIETLVVSGMQSEMCVRATSLEARERGFGVILVEDAHTTFNFDEQTAVEAIDSLNNELRSLVRVAPSSEIRF
jgi:nicotinamidase-related amidase